MRKCYQHDSKCSAGDPLTEEEATWLINKADNNHDGCIDFDEFMKAYEVFGNASKEKALKVIISNG